jgi:hypothetical protein
LKKIPRLAHSRTRSSVLAALLCLGVGIHRPAFADQPEGKASEPATAAKTEARERFDRGVRLFEKGDNAAALAEFKRANELVPNPLVLYNMGLVYAAMNRPVESVDALGAFLAQSPQSQRGPRRHAQQIVDEQSARIARLSVRTQVPATIDVDGIEVGRTPMSDAIRVSSGAHIVGAQAAGYLPTRKEISLAGQTAATIDLDLQPAENRRAELRLSSLPTGAEILVNGQSVGTTPLPASLTVAPGNVRIEARREGYLPAERSLVLGDGARGEIAFALVEDPSAPASGRALLRIVASEAGAEVTVDGVVRPNPGAGVWLPKGQHRLRVALGGFEPYEKDVDLGAGVETPLAVVMVPTSETRARQDNAIHTRKVVGWTLLGVGAATAVGGTVYGVMQLGDVSDARKYRDGILAAEADWNNQCWAGQGPTYQLRGCDAIRADAEDRVDSAVLRRNLGFVGAGAGVVMAGIGAYLLASAPTPGRDRSSGAPTLSLASVWLSDDSAGMWLQGHF